MVDEVDQDRITEGVTVLSDYTEQELLTILQTLFQQPEKLPVLQEIVDWASPDHVLGSARVLLERRYDGYIKSYNEEKGYGFVTSDQVAASFGKDIFLSNHQLRNTGLAVGDYLSFVVLSNKGKPQAFDLQPSSLHPVKAPGGRIAAAAPAVGTNQSQLGSIATQWSPANQVNPVAATMLGDTRFQGFVKSFNPKKAYGFIVCEDLMMLHGKADIFVSDKELGGLDVGAAVSFATTQDKEGKPYAVNVAPMGNQPAQPTLRMAPASIKRPLGGAFNRPNAPPMRAAAHPGVDKANAPAMCGVVKSFSAKNQYGFIVAEELMQELGKPDIFVSAAELGELQPGEHVYFQVAVDDKGKAFAVNVESLATMDIDVSAGGAMKKTRFV